MKWMCLGLPGPWKPVARARPPRCRRPRPSLALPLSGRGTVLPKLLLGRCPAWVDPMLEEFATSLAVSQPVGAAPPGCPPATTIASQKVEASLVTPSLRRRLPRGWWTRLCCCLCRGSHFSYHLGGTAWSRGCWGTPEKLQRPPPQDALLHKNFTEAFAF